MLTCSSLNVSISTSQEYKNVMIYNTLRVSEAGFRRGQKRSRASSRSAGRKQPDGMNT